MKYSTDRVTTKKRLLTCTLKIENGCWEWQGSLRSGYGTLSIANKQVNTHRLSYIVFKGEIPEGLDVCHTCDNKICINPDHLFLGTRKENMEDAKRKGRLGKQGGGTYTPRKTSPHHRINTKAELEEVLSEISKNPKETMTSICRRLNFNYQSLIDYRKGTSNFIH